MLKKVPKYTIDLQNVSKKEAELVGSEAVRLASVYKSSIVKLKGFVIITQAFDDFIISQNLVTPITTALQRVRPFDHQSAVEASHAIAALINSADIPAFILDQIAEAYYSLSKVRALSLSTVKSSHVIPSEYLVYAQENTDNIYDLNSLIKKIKINWMQLFNVDSLEKRANAYYKGPLTMSLIVQKMIRPEISGKVYSIPPITKEDNTLEVHAQYGISQIGKEMEINPDIYLYDIKSQKITQKNIVAQESMYILKGRTEKNKDSVISVEISKEWRNQQKLPDSLLLELCKQTLEIEKNLKFPVEISWAVESGDIHFLEVKKINLKETVKTDDDLQKTIVKEKIPVEVIKQPEEIDLKKLQKEIEEAVKTGKEIMDPNEKQIEISKMPLIKPNLGIRNQKDDYATEIIETKTEIYTNVSNLSSLQLTALKSLHGGYFDITEEILDFGKLPEMNLHKTEELQSFQDSVKLDIETCVRAHPERRLMIKCSSISDREYELLKVDSTIYNATGDERFLEFPEALATELLAIKRAHKETYGDKLSVILPAVRSIENVYKLQEIAKIVKFDTFEIEMFLEIAMPSMLFQIDLIDQKLFKGIVINYPILTQLALYKTNIREIDHSVISQLIQKVTTTANQKQIKVFMLFDLFDEQLVKMGVNLGTNGFIFNSPTTSSQLEFIKKLENQD